MFIRPNKIYIVSFVQLAMITLTEDFDILFLINTGSHSELNIRPDIYDLK